MCSFPREWAGPIPGVGPGGGGGGGAMSVDWAALAQQWIIMKESCPVPVTVVNSNHAPSHTPTLHPAPPSLSEPLLPLPPGAQSINSGIEGGEAPMEVESNDMEAPSVPHISSQEWSSSDPSANWRNSWEQWNWNWNQPSGDIPNKMPLTTTESPYPGYSTDGNFNKFNNQQSFHPGYWSTGEGAAADDDKNNSRQRRVPRPPPPELLATPSDVDTTLTIDAAKRRKLPAWIRDGLEKMEREKQKQQEREKERQELLKQKQIEDNNQSQKQNNDVPALPVKSKFDSDSGESDDEKPNSKSRKPVKAAIPPPPVIQLSKEEYMQEIMLCVRRTLTEILLDVTTEQILSVCQEEVNRNRSRLQATQGVSVASKSQAFSAISGLGLGIYGDSSDSDSGESDNDSSSKDYRNKEDLSDKQLQESINRQKADFEKASKEIEARLASEEEALLKARSTPNEIGKEENLNKESDGEETSNNYRNDKSTSKQRKPSRSDTPPLPGNNAKAEKYDPKKKSKKKHKRSESYDKKKDRHARRDNSESSRSSSVSSSRSSQSSESQKRSYSDESRSSSSSKSSSRRKHNKKDSRKDKKSKKSKHNVESEAHEDSKKLDRSDNGSDRTSRSRTPDRKYSRSSKYSRRSRSHSDDRKSSRHYDYYSKSSKSSRGSYERRRDRSRSRDYRDRSRDRRGYSRDYDRRHRY